MPICPNNNLILGIDPGSRIVGYGLVQLLGRQQSYVASGCIRTQGREMAPRLQQIFRHLADIIAYYQPTEIAMEQVFMHKNVNSALKLGQARGAAIVAIGERPLFEYSPRQVKQAVVGYGAAEKSQVQHMVCALLKLTAKPQLDAADALAVALCHAHRRR